MDEKKYRVERQGYAEEEYRLGARKNSLPAGEKERKWITRLANHIQNLPTAHVVAGDPEYNALACCVSDEEAKIVCKMKLRKHYSLAELIKKTKLAKEVIEPLLTNLAMTGVLMYDPEDPEVGPDSENKKQGGYWVPIFVPGIMECLVDNVKLAEAHPEIPKAFNEYTIKRIMPLAGNLPVGGGVMRVIPIEKAIKDDPKHTVDEEISHYVETATDICVSPCSCRVARRIQGEGCGHLEDDMCIQFNEAARAFIHAGRGRRISKEECYEILKKAEDNGLMHEMPNTDGVGSTHALCNCCGCSCFSLRTGEYFHTATMVRSNYISKIDPDKCVACGECVEACPMNALKLGERLPNKKPIKVKTPLSAFDHKWGADKWNPDYRYNREYVMEETGTAPCKVACPAHIAIEGYLELARQGRFAEALALIKEKNPLPAVCGRVCNKRCEDACTRGSIDSPVSIDEVKKYIAQLDIEQKTRVLPRIEHPEFASIKMAVVGSGPAGISCAYYLAAKGYSVTVFEKEERLGGMLTLGIPSFRLEKDIVEAEIAVLKDLGVEFKTGVEVGKNVSIFELKEEGYKAIYLAIGAQDGRKLGVPGEENQGVLSGIAFLKAVNLGKAPRLHGRVAIMGGGNVAIDVARTAIRYGASAVDLYCLEGRDIMTAAKEEVEEAEKEGILIHNGWGVKEFQGERGTLKKAVLKKCVSVYDEHYRFNPAYDEKQLLEVECDFFISAIGQSYRWGHLLDGTGCTLLPSGRIKADPLTYQSDDPDIFVGGDCYLGPRFAIDAIATGKEGAESMHRHVHEGQSLLVGRAQNPYLASYMLDKDNIVVQGFDNAPRVEVRVQKLDDPMKDGRVLLSEEEVKKEAGRCLKCGRTYVDETMCVGCGLCTTKCKFDAISLVRRFDAYGVPYEKSTTNAAPHLISRNLKIVFTGKGKEKEVSKDLLDKQDARKETIR